MDANKVVSSDFKNAGNNVYVIKIDKTENNTPNYDSVRSAFDLVHKLIEEGKVKSSKSITVGGVAEAVSKMCFGNKIGFEFLDSDYDIYAKNYGDIIIETSEDLNDKNAVLMGKPTEAKIIKVGNEELDLDTLIEKWENPLTGVFPIDSGVEKDEHSCSESPRSGIPG